MITAAMLLAPVKDEPSHAFVARKFFANWCKDGNHVPTKRKAREWLRIRGNAILPSFANVRSA